MKPFKGHLQNWAVQHIGPDYIIWGFFHGHPVFDGKYGHTSKVIFRDGNSIETLNSRYTLGYPQENVQCSGEHSPTISSPAMSQASTPSH